MKRLQPLLLLGRRGAPLSPFAIKVAAEPAGSHGSFALFQSRGWRTLKPRYERRNQQSVRLNLRRMDRLLPVNMLLVVAGQLAARASTWNRTHGRVP